ncbi:hypothetical protein R4K92_01505 [Brachyspira intermedia]|uniref:hypothetical protein n=1 Tax=Brachyspira intermedia TaxID=84377 RepID=UPI00300514BF
MLNNKIDFSNSIFNDIVDFTGAIFYNFSIDFSNCLFKDIVKLEGSKFYGGVNSNLYFNDSIFEKKIIFDYSKFYNFFLINYKNAQFLDETSFYETKFKINKGNYSILDFSEAIIHKDIIFRYCDFQDTVLFNNTIFYGNIDMYSAKIGKKIVFFNTEISNEINFDNIIFKNKNTILSINNDKFQKINKINFENIIIDGRINIQNISVNIIDFSGTIINLGLFITVNFKVHKFANRESALFLKNEAYARNNAIDALQYKAQEVELHKDELIKKSNKTYKDWADIFSIGLSSLYSDNGQNWIKALFMTIFITALCFTVFYIPDLTDSNIIRIYYRNLFPELIKYFIPTDYSLIIKYAASKLNLFLKIFGVLVYFLGKILFWYGSVQTVQAFRKFAKGA